MLEIGQAFLLVVTMVLLVISVTIFKNHMDDDE